MKRTFLIDTDTASDDAVALIMPLRATDVNVAAITTVAGNVPVEQATENALYVVELCGSDVAVYKGADKPLLREYVTAEWFHGKDGLGDRGYPAPSRSPEDKHAVDAIAATINENPEIVIVTLGPLTNIALAIAKDPGIISKVSRCVIMGGNPCCGGNVTPSAEYNMWVDPEAARMVLRSGLPIELVGWQLCRCDAALSATDIEYVLSLRTPLAEFAIECNSRAQEAYRVQTGDIGISLPDPIAMAIAIDPTICTAASTHHVDVEVTSELTRGMTVVDRLQVSGDERNRATWQGTGKMQVDWTIDVNRWKQTLYDALRST